MIYLDSSALLKLVRDETESAALTIWMREQAGNTAVSSELAKIEVVRASRRYHDDMLTEARTLLESVDLIPMTSGLVETACSVGDPLLHSLDAIHLASALSIRTEISAFLAYDYRLCTAATSAGLPVLAPGQQPS